MVDNPQKHGALGQNPENNNFLNPQNFVMRIKRAPATNFFLQKVTIPGVQLPAVKQPTPFADVWQPGDHLTYNPFTIQYKVDEGLQNYFELYDWIHALGLPDNLEEYGELAKHPVWTQKGVKSEIILSILDFSRNPIYNLYLHDAFPIALSDMQCDLTPQGITYLTATASFRYTTYDWERLNEGIVVPTP